MHSPALRPARAASFGTFRSMASSRTAGICFDAIGQLRSESHAVSRTGTYRLYFSPDSANLVVRLALELWDVPYKAVLVDRGRREQRSAAYRRLNPQGLIPVLVDRDTVLFETGAILLYLAERHRGLAPPSGDPARGDCLKWLFFLSNTLHADLRIAFYRERYADEPDARESVGRTAQRRALGHFRLLEQQLAAHGGPWLLPWGRSVCDIYLAVCARWTRLYPPGSALPPGALDDCPRLLRICEALERDPAVARACTAEGIPAPFFSQPQPAEPETGSVL